jgi:hypothetical protein
MKLLKKLFRLLYLWLDVVELRLQAELHNLRDGGPPSPVKRVSEAEAPAKTFRLARRTFAEEQAAWEWKHNKKAQEIVERQQSGFF